MPQSFKVSNHWDMNDFKQAMQILDNEIQKLDNTIRIDFGEHSTSIIKKVDNDYERFSITAWGTERYVTRTMKAIVIHYSKYDTKRIYAKNPNVLFKEASIIVNKINESFQWKLKSRLKENHAWRLIQRKESEWKDFAKNLGVELDYSLSAKIDGMTISKHDKVEITPTKMNLSISGINVKTFKKIQAIMQEDQK